MSTADPSKVPSIEALRQQLAAEIPQVAGPISPLEGPVGAGMLRGTLDWLAANTEVADAGIGGALRDPIIAASGAYGILLDSMAEVLHAFLSAGLTGLDALLVQHAPHITTAAGRMRCGILTPFTDRDALIRDLIGPRHRHPRYRRREPQVPLLLDDVDSVTLGEALGLSVRELAEVRETHVVSPKLQRKILDAVAKDLGSDDPGLGATVGKIVGVDLDAAASMPAAQLLFALARGVRLPRRRLQMQFIVPVEIGKFGVIAMVFWNRSGAYRPYREEVAGYVRQLADTYIAPWNRWPDQRRRREALYLYIRRAGHQRPQIDRLSQLLRERHPSAYESETMATTRRRLYVASSYIRRARLPAEFRPVPSRRNRQGAPAPAAVATAGANGQATGLMEYH